LQFIAAKSWKVVRQNNNFQTASFTYLNVASDVYITNNPVLDRALCKNQFESG